jgi:hypothetical protein
MELLLPAQRGASALPPQKGPAPWQDERAAFAQDERAAFAQDEPAASAQDEHLAATQDERAAFAQDERAAFAQDERAAATQNEHLAVTQDERAAFAQDEPAAATQDEPGGADGENALHVPPAPIDESRTGGGDGNTPAEGEAQAAHERTPDGPDEERLTDKGLPKRTPKFTAPAEAPRRRTGSAVDAEALRRRLGGFRRGAEAGYRDVAAEIAEQTAQNQRPSTSTGTAESEEATGGTVEEASS